MLACVVQCTQHTVIYSSTNPAGCHPGKNHCLQALLDSVQRQVDIMERQLAKGATAKAAIEAKESKQATG